jgi:hypothetical protein
MNSRLEKLMAKVEEKGCDKLQKRAEMLKLGASILDEAGAVGGGTLGGVTGMTLVAQRGMDLPAKYRALAALLGGIGGGAVGAMGGSTIGQLIADKRRAKDYEEVMQDAAMNRNKALMDAIAMKAFSGAGLVQPPANVG